MKTDLVQIFEVGPRDGLQNESHLFTLKEKIWFISSLIQAGVRNIEIGAFVRPDRVPQMADTDQLCHYFFSAPKRLGLAQAWCLVPNKSGLQRALEVGVTHFAVFTAATETFAKKNIGMTIQQSLKEFQEILRAARVVLGSKLKVRGYVSTAFGCPFEGKVAPKKVLSVIEKLAALGVDQISIGDTIGVAHPASVQALIQPALKMLDRGQIAVHFHDTRGTALANTLRSIDLGIRTIDSSAGGLGGCPYAPGAAGNLATEDLLFMLNGMGMRTGIDLDDFCKVTLKLFRKIKRPLTSRYLQTYVAQFGLE